jgi:hypothetical protein
LYANDFDDNGSIDPILCYYIQGKSYPMASRDELLDQIVPLRKKYVKYKDYADATVNDIFPADKIKAAKIFRCNELASGILFNEGNTRFSFKPFPLQAQFSRVSAVEVNDFDKDGIKDILVAGNFYPYRVQLGNADASLGLFLKGTADKSFTPIDPSESGCYAGGDVRAMVSIKDKNNHSWLVFARNNDSAQVLKINR